MPDSSKTIDLKALVERARRWGLQGKAPFPGEDAPPANPQELLSWWQHSSDPTMRALGQGPTLEVGQTSPVQGPNVQAFLERLAGGPTMRRAVQRELGQGATGLTHTIKNLAKAPIPDQLPKLHLPDLLSPNRSEEMRKYVESVLGLGGASPAGRAVGALGADVVMEVPRVLQQLLKVAKPPEGESRAAEAVKALPFVGPAIEAKFKENISSAKTHPDEKLGVVELTGQGLKSVLGVAADFVAAPLGILLSGEVPDGGAPLGYRPATPEESSRAVMDLGMLFAGLREAVPEALKHTSAEWVRGVETPPTPRTLKTTAELDLYNRLKERAAEARALAKGKAQPLAAAPTAPETLSTIDRSLARAAERPSEYPVIEGAAEAYEKIDKSLQEQMTVKQVLDTGAYDAVVGAVVTNPVTLQVATDLLRQGHNFQSTVAKIVADPELVEIVVPDLLRTYGNIADVRTAIAGAVENTTHYGAQSLAVLSDMERHLTRLKLDALSPDLVKREAAQAHLELFKEFTKARQLQSKTNTSVLGSWWQKIVASGDAVEAIRIPFILSRLSTLGNIMGGQGLTGFLGLADAAFGALARTGAQALSGEAPTLKKNFADFTAVGKAYEAAGKGAASFVEGFEKGELPTFDKTFGPLFDQWATLLAEIDTTGTGMALLDTLGGAKVQLMNNLLAEAITETKPLVANAAAALEARARGLATTEEALAYLAGPQNFDLARLRSPKKWVGIAKDSALALGQLGTLPIRIQEELFRRLFFSQRLQANLERMGVPLEEFFTEINRREIRDPKTGEVLEVGRVGPDGEVRWEQVGSRAATATDIPSILPADLRAAIADATDYALASTWAKEPGSQSLMGMMLQITRNFNGLSPIKSGMIVTPFTRALANSVMWVAEHSPDALLKLLDPDYRDTFLGMGTHLDKLRKVLDDPKATEAQKLEARRMAELQSVKVQREVGQALTGLGLLGIGVYLWNDPNNELQGFRAGPKPYLLTTGSAENGTYEIVDVRSRSPQLYAYLTLGALLSERSGGRPVNMTPMEILEALANADVTGYPVFGAFRAAQDLARQRTALPDGGVSASETLYELLGQTLGGFGNISQSWIAAIGRDAANVLAPAGTEGPVGLGGDIVAWARNEEGRSLPQPITRSTSLDTVIQPLAAQLAPQHMELDYDPFTGEPRKQPTPRQGLAIFKTTNITPLQDLLLRTPGMHPGMLTDRFEHPRAQALVNRYTGLIVQGKPLPVGNETLDPITIDGMSLQEYAKRLNAYAIKTGDYRYTNFVMGPLLGAIRAVATASAMRQDMVETGQAIPPHFISDIAKRQPTFGLPDMRRAWEQLLREASQLGLPPATLDPTQPQAEPLQ